MCIKNLSVVKWVRSLKLILCIIDFFQTFYELTNDTSQSVPCQAGFVPPLPSFPFEQDSQEHSLGSSDSNTSESWATPPPSSVSEDLPIDTNTGNLKIKQSEWSSCCTRLTIHHSLASQPRRKNMGGRRPKSSAHLSPEEEEKRKLRRERNKMAAARCRKRRVDQTNELVDKVTVLEKEKKKLQNEIEELQLVKDDLEFTLDTHRAQCRLVMERKNPLDFKPHIMLIEKIKEEPLDSVLDDELLPPPPKKLMLSTANPIIASVNQSLNTPPVRPSRPSSLNVPLTMTPSQALHMNKNVADIAGVPITTPSTSISFNFDSLMDGGTGLTPVSQPLMPTCSTQNKNPMDLATPTTEPSKLVSL